jgi:hypothetical protein
MLAARHIAVEDNPGAVFGFIAEYGFPARSGRPPDLISASLGRFLRNFPQKPDSKRPLTKTINAAYNIV